MLDLVNALAAVVIVTTALALASLDWRVAILLGATGGLTGTFLAWLAAPGAWTELLVMPWLAAIGGTILAIIGWGVVRAHAGLFEPPWSADDTGTGTLPVVQWNPHVSLTPDRSNATAPAGAPGHS